MEGRGRGWTDCECSKMRTRDDLLQITERILTATGKPKEMRNMNRDGKGKIKGKGKIRGKGKVKLCSPITHNHPIVRPLLSQDLLQQLWVLRNMRPVDAVVSIFGFVSTIYTFRIREGDGWAMDVKPQWRGGEGE